MSAGEAGYDLTLFVSGASDLSARAVSNARELCETHLPGRYQLGVIDVNEDSSAFLRADLVAVPALVRNRPLPVRHVVGDLAHTDRVLRALDLPLGSA